MELKKTSSGWSTPDRKYSIANFLSRWHLFELTPDEPDRLIKHLATYKTLRKCRDHLATFYKQND